MRRLRFYFAMNFAKLVVLACKITGRKGTTLPGFWAILLCPDFLKQIEKPKKVIGVMGTNGKTTTSNMIEDILDYIGEEIVCNRSGTNVDTGLASVLINNSTFTGKQKKQIAVFEMDERGSTRIFKYLKPNVLLVTNIFRDSYKRNAHTEYIFELLDSEIPKGIDIILNGDDPLCSKLANGRNAKFFGIKPQDFEKEKTENIVKDGDLCPACYQKLTYDFARYHHIGIAHCESCGFKFPERDYIINKVNLEKSSVCADVDGEESEFKLIDPTPINAYNQISAISVLSFMGYSNTQIKNGFDNLKIIENRHNEIQCGDVTLKTFLAKGLNPIACSRVFDVAKTMDGKKCVILVLENDPVPAGCVENIAWYYDTDFENLNDPSINQIIIEGSREADIYLRLLIAGVDPTIIKHFEGPEKISGEIDYNKSNSFVFLHDMKMHGLRQKIIDEILVGIKNNRI